MLLVRRSSRYDDVAVLVRVGVNLLMHFVVNKDRDYSPVGQIQLAGMLLGELVTFTGGWTGPLVEERKQVTLVTFLHNPVISIAD